MQRWQYKRLFVWTLVRNLGVLLQGPVGWYLECGNNIPDDPLRGLLHDYFYAGGSSPTRLLLNPARDWKTSRYERLAWDEDAGWADLAIDIMAKLGVDGWELVGTDPISEEFSSVFHIFKRPLE